MHDDAYPQLALPPAPILKSGVVAGQELAKSGDDAVEHERLVGRVDQREQAITTVGEPARRRVPTPAERSAAPNSS